jgi:hypothetical protein
MLPLLLISRCRPVQPRFYQENFANITFVSVPRPYRTSKEYLVLKLAISNWISTSDRSRVILIVDGSQFDRNRTLINAIDHDFGPGRLVYTPTLETNRDNVPYINNWFNSAVKTTAFNVLTLINSDIFLPSGWLTIVRKLLDIFGATAFITGYRLNFDLDDAHYSILANRTTFQGFDIDGFVHSCDHQPYSYRGMDFFTFLNHPGTRLFELFPPFLMGKYEWDNWLMGTMYKGHQTISLGPGFRTYHVNHPATANERWSPDSAYNKRLRILYFSMTGDNQHTRWTLVNTSHVIGQDNTLIAL